MFTVHVTIHVKPECLDDFITASLANHRGTRQEPGNLRWDLLQDCEQRDTFYLYEVYANQAAHLAHQQTPHYLTWRDAVADLTRQPRTKILADVIAPEPWQ